MATAACVPATGAEDARLAVRNAVKLTGSLLATWAIALAIRLVMPRLLGPDRFGSFRFADSFTATLFVALQLGIDTHVRTAVSVRPELAREFFGGVLALRLALTALLCVGMVWFLRATGRSPEMVQLALVLAAGQLLTSINTTLSAMLHAAGRVDGLSITTVVTKVLWAAGVGAALFAGGSLIAIAAALCLSEALKAAILWRITRRHLAVDLSVHAKLTLAALLASVPFFLNGAAQSIYARIDATILSMLASDREVGFYGAAAALGQVAGLVTPLIAWVLIPLFSRAAARSPEELARVLRRSMVLSVAVGVPVSLALALGAKLWVHLLFGDAFAPAASALRLLAPLFALTYVTMSLACALLAAGRGWTVTLISIGSMVLNTALNVALIPAARSLIGHEGFGGVGCSLAMVTTESLVAVAMIAALGGRVFDRASVAALAKLVLACAPAVAVYALVPAPVALRVLIALAAYAALVAASGAVNAREVAGFARAALRRNDAET